METQAIQRTVLNVLLGAVDQYAVSRGTDPVRTQTIASAAGIVVGGALEAHRVLRRDRYDHPWERLAAEGLLGTAGTILGQVGTGYAMQQLNKANQNGGSGSGNGTGGATGTYTGDAADAAAGSTAQDVESYQYPEGSTEDVA